MRQAHAQATFTNRDGGLALVNLSVRPLSPDRWAKIDRLCDRCGDALFSSDDLPEELLAELFGQPGGLLPAWSDFALSCSHCRTPFCLYRAATLLAVAGEFDRRPIRLLELRGARREQLFMRAAQQTPEAETELEDAALSALLGVDLESRE